VRKEIEQKILEGSFQAGAKLIQQDLADEFGVSLSVVREALLELRATGLVETVDNRGAFVSSLTRQKIIEALEVRASLEGLAVQLCCDRATRADLRALGDMARRIFDLASRGQRDEAASLDREFHQRLIHLSRNSMLERLQDNYRMLGKVLRFDRDAADVRNEHLALLEAIGQNRPEEAERIVKNHILHQAKDRLEKATDSTFVPHWVH
jgi:DNA-binding GntR family transcriptional regulator